MTIWYTVWPFGLFSCNLYILWAFGAFYQEKSGNPGTIADPSRVYFFSHVRPEIQSSQKLVLGKSKKACMKFYPTQLYVKLILNLEKFN
jgi:hypothetical protein